MLDLEKKLYQLIIARLDGGKIPDMTYQEHCIRLVRKGIGGFIVFGGNKDVVKSFLDTLQSYSSNSLFIASDIERGLGQQLEGATHFPSQMAAAAVGEEMPEDRGLIEDMVRAVAREAIDSGINMPLIPVMDVNQNPDNPIVCTRAFSDNPETVARFGSMYINVIESAGLMSCAKHFPGHGDTNIDSHVSLPTIAKPMSELKTTDIYPFKEAIKAGVSSIMIAHLNIPEIDSLPASLSKKIIHNLLREELGFDGLVMTDALNMHALNDFENVPAKCINAGVDILLHPSDPEAVVEELKRGVSSGVIEITKIDAAIERIMKYKSGIQNIRSSSIDSRKHQEISNMISDKSITLVQGELECAALNDIHDSSLIYVGDENGFDISLLRASVKRSITINEASDDHSLLNGTAVFALFTSIAAWKGSSGIKHEDVTCIKECIKKSEHSIVISFGSPYVLRHFKEADILIAAYDTSRQAQASVVKCLKGEIAFKGLLPVHLSFS